MIAEDIPADDIRFPAGKPGHDRLQISRYDRRFPVPFCCAFVQAGGGVRLHNDKFRRGVSPEIRQITDDGSREGTDAGLDKHMRRAVSPEGFQLFSGF